MAYKNKNKNKRHVRILRISQGDIAVKHYREQERENKKWRIKHPDSGQTIEQIESILKERGLM